MSFLQELLDKDEFVEWLREDRSFEEIRSEMRLSIDYVKDLVEQTKRSKARARAAGKNPDTVAGFRDRLLKADKKNGEGLSGKISKDEYLLGKWLQTLLGPQNCQFFADRVRVQHPFSPDEQADFFAREETQKQAHSLILQLDDLEPRWRQARRLIQQFVTDYTKSMDMGFNVSSEADTLSQSLRLLATEIVKLWEDVDPGSADRISRQAHRKILDYTLHKVEDAENDPMIQPEQVLHPAEVKAGRAYRVLVHEFRDKKTITNSEFQSAVAKLVQLIPVERRKTWLKVYATQKSYHGGFAKYLSEVIAPLVETLDQSFDSRALVAAIGNRKGEINFEPDYLLRTLSGETVWGEYLGMSAETSSGGTHYNIRSLLKKIGYGDKGVFFFPNHLRRFPSPDLLSTLLHHNVIGWDGSEQQYYTVIDGKRDYIIRNEHMLPS
jgi:hypothetical protein